MIESLDKEASRLGVTRQSIIKVRLSGGLQQVTSNKEIQQGAEKAPADLWSLAVTWNSNSSIHFDNIECRILCAMDGRSISCETHTVYNFFYMVSFRMNIII